MTRVGITIIVGLTLLYLWGRCHYNASTAWYADDLPNPPHDLMHYMDLVHDRLCEVNGKYLHWT